MNRHDDPRLDKLFASPAYLRGAARARHEAAKDSEPGSDDHRVNTQIAAELERRAERAEGVAT